MGEPTHQDHRHLVTQLETERARLEAILQQLPLAVVIAEAPDGRLIMGNQQVEAIFRHPYHAASNVDGYREYRGLRPDGTMMEPHEWPLARALSSGEVIVAEEVDILRGDGTRGTIRLNAAPIHERDGTIQTAVVVFEDITEQRRNERALEFLIEASEILAKSLDYETTLESVAGLIVPRLADWCVVDIVDDAGAIRRLAMKHRDPDRMPLLQTLEYRYPHRQDSAYGPARVMRTGKAELHSDINPDSIERAALDAEHLLILRALDIRSYMCVPLVARERTVGAISFTFSDSGRRYTEDDLKLAEELGRRVAIAVDNAHLFRAEQNSRALAEEAGRRITLLANISRVLASSLDYDVTLEQIAELAIPELADACIVDIVEADGRMYRPAVAHSDPEQELLLRQLSNDASPTIDDDSPHHRAIRSGQPLLVPRITEEMVRASVPEHALDRMMSAGYQSALILPLVRHGTVLGALSFASYDPGRYTAETLPYMRDVAERAAIAIENARLFRDSQIAEARYRSLFEHAADAILVADVEGRYLDANPAAVKLVGYSRDEILGMRVGELVTHGPAWTDDEYARYVEDGYWHGELALRRKDGTEVPVEATATIARLRDGAVYLSVVRDITERRAAERMQRDFMTMVTHDLKSPLTSIKGFAQLMQRREAYSKTAVDSIVGQTSHLERLINDMLDAARLEAGQAELRHGRVDLVTLGRTVLDYCQALTQDHHLRFESTQPQIIGWWDQDRLAQVIQNLLSNAIKYSTDGDILLHIDVRQASGMREAVVSVSDQGMGIPVDALPRIFERFYRHESAERGHQGLGLGLYISRSLIEAHGGRITVESNPTRGSTFRFTLPLGEHGNVSR